MNGQTLYHIEKNHGQGWVPEKVRKDGAHNLAAFEEWFANLDECKTYTKRGHAKFVGRGLCGQTKFRVTDHLGNVYWKGDGA